MARSISRFDDVKNWSEYGKLKITQVDRLSFVDFKCRYTVIARYEHKKHEYCIFDTDYLTIRKDGSIFVSDFDGPFILKLDGSRWIGSAGAIARSENSTKTLKSAVEIFRQMFPKKKFYTFE